MNTPNEPTPEQKIWDHQVRRHFMWMALRFACLPLADHKPRLEDYYKNQFEDDYKGPLEPDVLRMHLAFLFCYRIMLGRAVQPRGPLSNLAPIVGAIRLKDRCAKVASEYLAPRLLDALKTGRSDYIARVRRLTQEPLGQHRSHQIWVAIFELRNTGNFNPSRLLAKHGAYLLFPNTKEVKDYISSPGIIGARRFSDLPTDEAALTRLLNNSGAKLFVEAAVRGKANRT